MAYKYSKGKTYQGDIYNEDDTQKNTFLDWSEDAIGLVAGGELVLAVSASVVSSSANLSASAFYGDGSGLSNISAAGSNAQIQFNDNGSTGAAAQLYWSEANNRLGIGTNNPSKALDIEDADSAGIQLNATNHRAYTVASDGYGFIVFDNTTGGAAGYRFVISDQAAALGYVGIGAGASIAGNNHPDALLHLSSSDDGQIFRADTTDGTTVLFATGSNRVGIGTSSPTSTFEVSGSQAGNYTQTTGNITFNETHYIVDYTGDGAATFTLPDVSGITGRTYHIISHNQHETAALTITGSGGQFQGPNLDNDSDSIDIDGWVPQSVTVVSTGGNWFILVDNRSQGPG